MVTDFRVFYAGIRSIERTPTRDVEMSKNKAKAYSKTFAKCKYTLQQRANPLATSK